MEKITCPRRRSPTDVRKWGRNRAGTRRYCCLACQGNFTLSPKEQGHGTAMREQAVQLYLEGMSQRAIE
jgi:transposase-like protein